MQDVIRILVVEGNTAEASARIVAFGGRPYAQSYAGVLTQLDSRIVCTIVHPCEQGVDCVPDTMLRGRFDGVVWTGSSLSAYSFQPPVHAQIQLAQRVYNWGIPIFGSCWGLQVMTVALGGAVRHNPRGREIGVARAITLSACGEEHAMFDGKPMLFDALTTHVDEVYRLPAGGIVLAGNDVCPIQAAAWRDGARSFWGVQYHPEFDLSVLANAVRRNAADLIEEGFFSGEADVVSYAGSLEATHANPEAGTMKRRLFGITPAVADPAVRHRELRNWLLHEVMAKRAQHSTRLTPRASDVLTESKGFSES
jgi:GMP synthase (glutamine-hydrolysing)